MTIAFKNYKPWRKPKFWGRLSIFLVVLIISTLGGITLYISSLDISKLQTPLAHPSYLYDQKGNRISELSSSRIEPVTGQQIPLIMKKAIIAVEDRRYYEHQGVDLRSISRALYRDLISGDFSEGGSTITQQLAKNLFLASDKTLARKLKEAAYALKIEAVLDKDEILVAYVDYVIEEAINRIGFTEEQILNGGLQIYTQMDPAVQKAAEEVYDDNRFFPSGKSDQIVQSGVVVLDHSTGGIKGLVGYRGERVYRGLNHATSTQLERQPGSALKPLSVYAPALEKGYTPDSKVDDHPLNINGYSPKNYDNQYRGYITMQEAVRHSWNVPAVWLLNEIGVDSGVDFTERSGIPLEKEDHTLSLALGGLSKGVSPLQMAQAYGVFANLGVMNKAYAISKITTKEGSVLFQARPEAVQVTTSRVAYMMTLMLQDVVTNGTGKKANLIRPTAGKTGSVELPHTPEFSGISKGVKDVWFVGYTPELTAAVWMGYDNTDRNHYLTTSGGSEPAVVFREILSRALKSTSVIPFEIPQDYIEQNKLSNRFYKWFQDNFNFKERDDEQFIKENGSKDKDKGKGKDKD
ncbi:transglycosylase domain-containing protein [Desulfosporosinus burensis]